MILILLSESAGGKHFSDEVEGPTVNVDPRGIGSDNGVMVEALEEVDFGVEAL